MDERLNYYMKKILFILLLVFTARANEFPYGVPFPLDMSQKYDLDRDRPVKRRLALWLSEVAIASEKYAPASDTFKFMAKLLEGDKDVTLAKFLRHVPKSTTQHMEKCSKLLCAEMYTWMKRHRLLSDIEPVKWLNTFWHDGKIREPVSRFCFRESVDRALAWMNAK